MSLLKNFLSKIYYLKYSKISYSISNVDLIIERIFKDVKKGVYVDLGCNHPIKYNNTYLLYKKGWEGINIDADVSSIKLFNQHRKNDVNVNGVVSNNEDIKKLYLYHDGSAINTLSKNLVDSRSTKPKKTIERRAITLNKIIENSRFKNTKINLLSVDIENHEFESLQNFNFSKYKIDIIVVECIDLKLKELEVYNQSLNFVINSNIYKLLVDNSYKLINWVHSDLIFVRNDFKV